MREKDRQIEVKEDHSSTDILSLHKLAYTECPKIYRPSVLHLLKYTTNLQQMQYRFAVNFGTLSRYNKPSLIVISPSHLALSI